jgi:hypothetical protein
MKWILVIWFTHAGIQTAPVPLSTFASESDCALTLEGWRASPAAAYRSDGACLALEDRAGKAARDAVSDELTKRVQQRTKEIAK